MASRTPSTRAARTKPAPTTTTRTTRAAATKNATATAAAPTTEKKTAARKPPLNRKVSPEGATAAKKAAAKKPKLTPSNNARPNVDREPIKAYLRIRPQHGDDTSTSSPYLQPLSDTSVRMTDPSPASHRLSTAPPSSIYTFSRIFPTTTPQSEFFTYTTLPLVQDLLDGQNGLLFAYGVTNSGKTYTVQGGSEEGSAGILPRTLDVVFNSIEGLHAEHRYRPVRLQGVEDAPTSLASSTPRSTPASSNAPALADILAEHFEEPTELDVDPTVLPVDRNHEYSIWLSYAEVYNEKVYDLLHTVNCDDTDAKTIRPSFITALSGGRGDSLLLTRKALPVKPEPASDGGTGKYVAGLRQIRVHSAAEAKALLKLGQLHRRVFGTLANSQSSRSHGVVTIKVLRNHKGEREDASAYQTARLTLVDLAGSERTRNTQTSGERLREAGNINKSLMVLGQCMEVLRSNQRRLAQSLSQPGRGDTRDVRRGLRVVPFRHSKLTEVLMDYFAEGGGGGRVGMIVNVNPYDTGYEENGHVMRFAAVAREVAVQRAGSPVKRAMSPTKKSQQQESVGLGFAPNRRKVMLSSLGANRKVSQTQVEIVEEDEETAEQGSDDDPELIDPMVDALFEEIDILRLQLVESQLRCAMIEAETREEVMKEMDERMRSMEGMFQRRLMNEIASNEMKTNAKIDMLHRAGAFGKSSPPQSQIESSAPKKEEIEDSEGDTSEMEDIETSLVMEDEDEDESSVASSSHHDRQRKQSIVQRVPDGPEALPLPSEDEDGATEVTEVTEDRSESEEDGEEEGEDGEDNEEESDNYNDEEAYTETDDDQEWEPEFKDAKKARKSAESSTSQSTAASRKKPRMSDFDEESSEDEISMLPKSPMKKGGRMAKPKLVISSSDEEEEDITMPTPKPLKKSTGLERKMRSLELSDDEDELVEVDQGKKKKRTFNKKAVVTEDQIEKIAAEQVPAGTTRRVTRGTRRS